MKNIALIPARKNSKGLKYKNRLLFNNTANFIKKLKFIDKILVSSDDPQILKKALDFNFFIHKRKKKYAKDDTSIKKTIINICEELNFNLTDNIWLFYLPIVKRSIKDFERALFYAKKRQFKSMCTFYEADYKYHPYYSWKFQKKKVVKYIKNDFFRRQDLPKAFYHFHYVSCFKVKEIKNLNSELINHNTVPLLLKKNDSKIFEIDNIDDLKKFKNVQKI